jgi:hypothetical protein
MMATALLKKEGEACRTVMNQSLQVAVQSIVRMIAGAVTTHVTFVVHYHLHATTSFQGILFFQ